jgi:hypothetical protein
VRSAHTGQPVTEELLFGTAGGIGVGYFVFDMGGKKSVYLGTRYHTKETTQPEFLAAACSRLGLKVRVQKATSIEAARKRLDEALDDGRHPIVWVDRDQLPYYAPFGRASAYHTCVLCGRADAGRLAVADLAAAPLSITPEALDAARTSTWAPGFRVMFVEAGPEPIDPSAAVREGISSLCEQMSAPPIANFGLKGFGKMAESLTHARDKKAWPTFFPPGLEMFKAMISVFEQIETRGYGGSAFREEYADFLDESAELLGLDGLRAVATRFRSAAKLWGQLADAALPDASPLTRRWKELIRKKHEAFRARGLEDGPGMDALNAELASLLGRAGTEFPFGPAEAVAFRAGLAERVLAIRTVEEAAVNQLRETVDD